MDIEEIMSILPHRPPFLFVDEVLEISEKRILAKRNNVVTSTSSKDIFLKNR